MKQDLRKIDVDFIRELRGEGRSFEANELLRAYYKDVKKAGKNALYDECKHQRIIRKLKGICIMIGCPRKAEKWTHCSRCHDNKLKFSRKYTMMKRVNKCEICGKLTSTKRCAKHAIRDNTSVTRLSKAKALFLLRLMDTKGIYRTRRFQELAKLLFGYKITKRGEMSFFTVHIKTNLIKVQYGQYKLKPEVFGYSD